MIVVDSLPKEIVKLQVETGKLVESLRRLMFTCVEPLGEC